MYWINADVTIESGLDVISLSELISTIFNMPPFILDDSGDWEGDEVYASSCFGFNFLFSADDSPLNSYHLAMFTDGDAIEYGADIIEICFDANLIALLNQQGIDAKIRFDD